MRDIGARGKQGCPRVPARPLGGRFLLPIWRLQQQCGRGGLEGWLPDRYHRSSRYRALLDGPTDLDACESQRRGDPCSFCSQPGPARTHNGLFAGAHSDPRREYDFAPLIPARQHRFGNTSGFDGDGWAAPRRPFEFRMWCSQIYTIRTFQHLLRRPTSNSAAATPRFDERVTASRRSRVRVPLG